MTEEPAAAPFAETIKLARESLGLSQEQWARRLGVSTRTVARWEAGDSEPRSPTQKAAIAQAMSAAGLGALAVGLGSTATTALGAAGIGVLGLVAGSAIVGPAVAVAAAYRAASKAAAYRRKSDVLNEVEQAAERLGLVPERLLESNVAMLDMAIRVGMTIQELRDLLAEAAQG